MIKNSKKILSKADFSFFIYDDNALHDSMERMLNVLTKLYDEDYAEKQFLKDKVQMLSSLMLSINENNPIAITPAEVKDLTTIHINCIKSKDRAHNLSQLSEFIKFISEKLDNLMKAMHCISPFENETEELTSAILKLYNNDKCFINGCAEKSNHMRSIPATKTINFYCKNHVPDEGKKH